MTHKHLAQTKLFWLFLIGPILIGGIVAIIIASHISGLYWCGSRDCFQEFLNIYKIPIAISGMSLPLVAMIAAIHRSKEAALQISYSQQQYNEAVLNNRFGNYLKHREGFEKLIDGYVGREGKSIRVITVSSPMIYASVFPDNGFNNANWLGRHDPVTFNLLQEYYDKLLAELQCDDSAKFDFEGLFEALTNLQEGLYISYDPCQYVDVRIGEELRTLLVPDNVLEHYALAIAATDAIEVFVYVRAYVGEKGANPHHILDTVTALRNMKNSRGRYRFRKPTRMLEDQAKSTGATK